MSPRVLVPVVALGSDLHRSDTGYRPRNWLPTKISIAGAGVVTAVSLVLWSRMRRPEVFGLVAMFIALAVGWYLTTE